MKKRWMALLWFVAMAAMFAFAQTADEGYQMATVVSIDRVPADAQHPGNADRYKIAMRLGNTVYSCHGNGGPAVFPTGARGSSFPPD